MALHVLASLTLRTRLSVATLEALLDRNCVHKYVMKFGGLGERGVQTVHLEFFDHLDRRRVQTALQKLAEEASGFPNRQNL